MDIDPHSSLGYLTPSEYARKRQEQRASEAADLHADPCGKWGKVTSPKTPIPGATENGSVGLNHIPDFYDWPATLGERDIVCVKNFSPTRSTAHNLSPSPFQTPD